MGVEFNEQKSTDFNFQPKRGGLTNLIIKMKLAKDESSAQKVMVVIALIFFVLAIYFFTKAF